MVAGQQNPVIYAVGAGLNSFATFALTGGTVMGGGVMLKNALKEEFTKEILAAIAERDENDTAIPCRKSRLRLLTPTLLKEGGSNGELTFPTGRDSIGSKSILDLSKCDTARLLCL
ncbi:hypothetical membrane protein [Candidatus Protochlamydia naegleriophila]|uniref:Hypothetical membrane protein n=1 Tax=Candidatus Protochlamydia naegleriophila TaxID=389348 RepID=A0A0U5EQN2_9BACT|nr:hypothetical protein [Candidatus Protochlamydia naegleriophila]CUI16451.1 hypothetical membrane protein [Candidatus Protochlamydia naegleriophila]